MKIPLAARVPSSVPPDSTSRVFSGSWLISTFTRPEGDSLAFTASSSTVSTTMVRVKPSIPNRIVVTRLSLGRFCRAQSWIPENDMNAIAISPTVMKVMPRPRSAGGTLL